MIPDTTYIRTHHIFWKLKRRWDGWMDGRLDDVLTHEKARK